MATIQSYAAFVERTLQDSERNHETSPMLVAGQVLSIVLTAFTRGTEQELAVKHLVQLWYQAVANEEGPQMPVEFTISAIRTAVESEELTNMQNWKEPKTSKIHLANGEQVQANVNGISPEDGSGYVLIYGRGDVKVVPNGDGTWREAVSEFDEFRRSRRMDAYHAGEE